MNILDYISAAWSTDAEVALRPKMSATGELQETPKFKGFSATGTSEGAKKGWESRLAAHGYKLDKHGTSNGKLYRAAGGHSVHISENDGSFHYENESQNQEKSGNLENLGKVLDGIHKEEDGEGYDRRYPHAY